MDFHWVLTGAALLAALAAYVKARRLTKRFERLSESYWELRYELSQLRARVNRLDPEEPRSAAAEAAGPEAPTIAFVPLSSLKK